ncbi:hypothetical protein CUJ83_13500 [Methanocella sp. CWC-04]|uniref:Uncharacterized protein n=1 Tax=Methanooceanicella nereidis TaxID=2052831 RepID=A0AAP2REU2_9EURY|nr:hypothetical protein [Methanocella sp. CWC-04]MCD1296013.1 hypothetical protein [Methanocella sp. CWC-04]
MNKRLLAVSILLIVSLAISLSGCTSSPGVNETVPPSNDTGSLTGDNTTMKESVNQTDMAVDNASSGNVPPVTNATS